MKWRTPIRIVFSVKKKRNINEKSNYNVENNNNEGNLEVSLDYEKGNVIEKNLEDNNDLFNDELTLDSYSIFL